GGVGDRLHAGLSTHADLVEAHRRAARVDRVEDGVGPLHSALHARNGALVARLQVAARGGALADGTRRLLRLLLLQRLILGGGLLAHDGTEVVVAVGDGEDDATVIARRVLAEV